MFKMAFPFHNYVFYLPLAKHVLQLEIKQDIAKNRSSLPIGVTIVLATMATQNVSLTRFCDPRVGLTHEDILRL